MIPSSEIGAIVGAESAEYGEFDEWKRRRPAGPAGYRAEWQFLLDGASGVG